MCPSEICPSEKSRFAINSRIFYHQVSKRGGLLVVLHLSQPGLHDFDSPSELRWADPGLQTPLGRCWRIAHSLEDLEQVRAVAYRRC